MYIDTHTHINFNDFKEDGDQVIREALSENVWMIVVGTDYRSSKKALNYANKYERGVFAAVGLHPSALIDFYDQKTNKTIKAEEFNNDIYEKLASFDKVVAIGEIGLDYYYLNRREDAEEQKKKQKDVFVKQLILARRLNLPVIIHCRQAHDDMLEILSSFRKEYRHLIPQQKYWGVIHCFSGDEDLAWKYFNLGLIISFTGIITFSNQWDDLIRRVPLEKIMIETDSPFLAPEPFRGKRNEPILVKYVAQHIANIKNISIEQVAKVTTRNAKEFFNIQE